MLSQQKVKRAWTDSVLQNLRDIDAILEYYTQHNFQSLYREI